MFDKAWSYSALNNYETCPKKYYHLNVLKDVKEPPSEHLTHGHMIHSAFERRIRDKQPLPIGTRQYEPILAALEAMPGDIRVEQKLALNADFTPCEWFAKNAWVRTVLDFMCHKAEKVFVLDYKTGRRKEDDDQLALMAGVVFCQLPEVTEITSSYFWMQEPAGRQFDTAVFKRTSLPGIFERFMPRVQRYQAAHKTTDFPAQPGGLCLRYCPVRKCPHHGV